MTAEHEPTPHFTIAEQQVDDLDEATRMRKQSWIDTYEKPELGITREWFEEYFKDRLSDEMYDKRVQRFLTAKASGTFNAWVARDEKGHIIGQTTPFIQEDGVQRLGSIYVEKAWHGKGVGKQLMQQALGWLDPTKPVELGVVSYNERAKAFYRKWGFVEIPGSETFFAEKLPEVRMIRQPQQQSEEK